MSCCVYNSTKCVICGLPIPGGGRATARTCRSGGLGDMVADGLAKVGITKERAQAVANAVGVKDCGCSQRQAQLNEIGREWLGIGE